MKTFNTPTIDIEKLDIIDVIATSGGCDVDCDGYEECTTYACRRDTAD